ncbi:MAG: adenylate/guanylate cyclase domain-containing protein [Spirochaetia bacterium]|nr:adenylate/guanylate cyclase domain-containing protein [Spirochaetia bacterium]
MKQQSAKKQKNLLLTQYTFFSIIWFGILSSVLAYYLNSIVETLILDQTVSELAELIDSNINAPLQKEEIDPYDIYEIKNDPFDYKKSRSFYSHILSHEEILEFNLYNRKKILAFSNDKSKIGKTFSSDKILWDPFTEQNQTEFFIEKTDTENRDFRILKFYFPLKSPSKKSIGIAEIHYNLNRVDQNINQTLIKIMSFTISGILIVFFILFIIIFKASRDLIKYQKSETIKNDLMRYFSPQVADSIISRKSEEIFGKPSREEVAILFMDIRGFTSQAENDDPGEIFELLNQFYEEMIEVIFKYNGVLDKIIGDSLMALFGVPLPDENKCDDALKTAIEMQQIANNFNIILTEKNSGKNFPIGIGINVGNCMAGNLGSEKRKIEYTVIGDPVNTAARLQGLAGPGEIIISEDVKYQLKGSYDTTPLDDIKLKGKEKAIKVYKVSVWQP